MSSATVCDLCGQIIDTDSSRPRIAVYVTVQPGIHYGDRDRKSDLCCDCSVDVLAAFPMLCPKFGVNE